MRFTCDSCGAQYMISDDKVGPNGVKVRCKKCSHVIVVRRPAPEPEPVVAAPPAPAAPRPDGLDEELGQAFDKVMSGGQPAESAAEPPPPPPPEPAAPLAAPTLAGEWYLAINDQQVGPLAPDGVRGRWEAGEIGPDTLVWCAGQPDWSPLSSVPALAGFLAPVPRGERSARPPEPSPSPAPAPAADRATTPEPEGWRPAAATALAALASEEMKATAAPAAAAGRPANGARSLLQSMELPDAGGVDPTGALPLPIKGLETTEERHLKRQSGIARSTAEIRLKRSANRTILLAAVALAVLVCASAAGLWWYFDRRLSGRETTALAPTAPAVPPAANAAPPATPPVQPPPESAVAAQAPAPPPPVAAPAAAPATPPSPAPVAAAAAAPSPAPPPEPAAAPAAPAPPPARTAARPEKAKKKAKAEASAKRQPSRAVAASEATAPASRKTGDPLLDASDVDADFERELSGGTKTKRSVYVPPPSGADLPDRLTEAQINEGVASRIDALKQCLEQQTAAQPDAHGTLKIRWVIQGDGGVSGVKSMSPEFGGQPISGCIASVVKTIRFPRSRTAGQEVVFPFRF
ncbi:MAG TPA: GYF domain-containing protein [Anaeromyxobacteraceae bacterium]|nr:GYF domain-containing protein [Anaeromyxobacteraceae bacterium]